MSLLDHHISISKFYENKNVFITGATGFIGRLLVEKLLRSCPGINKIYALVRPKRGKTVQERIKDIIDIPLFDVLRKTNKAALDKIVLVGGDTEKLGFGLTEEDKATIIENVTIIFHGAASIRFDDYIKKAVFSNTRSTREAVVLAAQLKKVDVFVDISTAYCNCDHFYVEETLYPAKIDWRTLIELAETYDEETLQYLTQKFIDPLPNTYTFTKGVAEHAVVELTKNKIPTVIARPSIVAATFREPVPGWIDNLNGAAAFIYGTGKGVIRGSYVDPKVHLNYVFADSVIKALLISAWKKAIEGTTDEVFIYNMASDITANSRQLHEHCHNYINENPTSWYLWPPNFYSFNNYFLYYFFNILYHLLPALIVDTIFIIAKKKPMLWKVQLAYFRVNWVMSYFMFNQWKFENKKYLKLNEYLLKEDRKDFSIEHFGENPSAEIKQDFFNKFCDGLVRYISKEGPTTEASRKKLQRYYLVEKIWLTFWALVAWYLVFIKFDIFRRTFYGTYNFITSPV